MDLMEKTGNLGGLKGNYYQVRVLMWLYQRLADGDSFPQYKDFELTTEMNAAGVFDDAVVKWNGTGGERKWLLVQVKHKISTQKLTRQHFFPAKESDEFSLYKYLLSFLDIERHKEFEGKKQYVIFTNSDVDDAIMNCFEYAENVAEAVLKISGSGARLMRIKIDDKVYEKSKGESRTENKTGTFCDQLLEYGNREFNNLAKAFQTIFIEGRSNFSTDLFKRYRGAIDRKILTVDRTEPVKVKFTKNFIYQTNLNASEQSLRIKVFGNVLPQDLKEITSTHHQLIEILTSKGKSDSNLPPCFDLDRDVKKFFERLIFAVNQPNNENLQKIITCELESRHGASILDPMSRSSFSSSGFTDLEKMVHDCLSSKKVTYLKKENLIRELRAAKCKTIYPELDVYTKSFKNEMQKLSIKFKIPDLPLQQLPLVIMTSTQKGLLTSIKLCQLLESNDQKIPFLYFSFKNLGSITDSNSPMRQSLLDVLKNRSSPLYLILQDDGCDIGNSKELLNFSQLGNNIRLILLTYKRDRATNFFREVPYSVFYDTANNISLLTVPSQHMLEEQLINFQGFYILLNEIPGYRNFQPIFQNEVLEKLILGDILTIGPNLPEMEAKHYISRKIGLLVSTNSFFAKKIKNTNQLTSYNEKQLVEAVPELFKQNKIILLSSIPGMGKSTLWTKLAQVAKKQSKLKWILHIKLQECSKHFRTDLKLNNTNNAIDFLSGILSFQSDFEKTLFENWLRSNLPDDTYIFMDGFDEMWVENFDKVITLLKILCRKARIFINTREHCQKDLESTLGVKAFSFIPMSKEDLRELFASTKFTKPPAMSIDQLVEKMESASMKLTSEFLGTPMIVNMLIEIYSTNFLNQQPVDLDSLDILFLFERFVYSSFYRQQVEQLKLDTKDPYTRKLLDENSYAYQGFEELHRVRGLEYLVDENKLLRFEDGCEKLHPQTLVGQSSIIVKYVDKFPYFIHRSFADFYAAKYLVNHLNLMKNVSINNGSVYMFQINFTPYYSRELSNTFCSLLRCFPLMRKFFFLIIQRHSSIYLERIVKILANICFALSPYSFNWACEANFDALAEGLVRECPAIVQHRSALHTAVEYNSISLCTLLIHKKADVDAKNSQNQTPLHKAASFGHIDIIKLLIKHGANNLSSDGNGLTPVDHAIQTGHIEVVEYLMSLGSQLTLMSKLKWNNQTKIVDFLKKQGNTKKMPLDFEGTVANLIEDKSLTCSDWKPTLVWAIQNGHSRVIRAMHKISVNIFKADETDDYIHPLHMAVEAYVEESVLILLECGANIEETTKRGYTPFLLAIDKGVFAHRIAKLLLENGASATATQNDNQNALHLVARCMTDIEWLDSIDLAIVKRLVIGKDKTGQTPLHVACKEQIQTFIDLGADVNSRDNNNRTPLLSAATRGDFRFVEKLLNHEVNVKAVDFQGMTHLDLAVAENRIQYVEYCLKYMPSIFDRSDVRKALNIANQYKHDYISELLESYLQN